jgi:hypothetical protein
MTYCLVLWEDAHCALDRLTRADAGKLAPVMTYTVGHMVSQSEAGVVVAVDAYPGEDGVYANWHMIPRGMIVAVRELVEREGDD